MNSDGHHPPLILFHGDYNGGGLYAARLATLLGPEQPLFAVAPHDLGQAPIPLSVQEIAANSVPLVLEAQPKGPYRLSGYCLGGLVAFEVARQLVARGEQVEIVSMIDSPTVSARPIMKSVLSAMRKIRSFDKTFADRAMKRTYFVFSQIDRPMNSLKSWARNVFRWRHDERNANLLAVLDYAPTPLAVPVQFFEAAYGSRALRHVSKDIRTVRVGGDHAEVVRDPSNLAMIADHLKAETTNPDKGDPT
jgi:thioesterase domain-containing protein